MSKLVLAVLACLAVAATAYGPGRSIEAPAYHEYGYDGDDSGYGNYDYDSGYDEPSYDPAPRRSRYGSRRAAAASYRPSRYDNYDTSYSADNYNSGYDNNDNYGYDDDNYSDNDYGYAPKRRSYGKGRRGSRMDRYGRSGTYGYAPKPRKHVPVIIKKKKEKKLKTISVHQGFYIPGGTAIFGKFKDLKSCQKACELTPTCFSGDFNPWLNKCYMHANLTACMSMRAHKQITHFKKVPCTIVETPRGLITLGAASWNGLQQKNIDSLMDCIKKCATAGGGVAPTPETAADTPQLCFGIDYDFADHTCYFHTLIAICGGNADANAIPLTPVSLYANPSTVNILICPLTT